MAYMGSKEQKNCGYSKCKKPLPEGCRKDKKFCDDSCRALSWKEKNQINLPDLLDRIGRLEGEMKNVKKHLLI